MPTPFHSIYPVAFVGSGSPPESECAPPGPKGGEQHSLTGKGLGGPNLDDWTDSLALCILSDVPLHPSDVAP